MIFSVITMMLIFLFIFGEDDEISVNGALAIKASENNPNHFTLRLGHLRDQDVEIFTRTGTNGKPILGSETKERDEREYFARRFEGSLKAGKMIHKNVDISLHIRVVREKRKRFSGFICSPRRT